MDLEVWQRAVDLAIEVYEVTSGFPREETFGLRMQMRRAAVSIASNVAEGEGRPADQLRSASDSVGRLISGTIRYLNTASRQPPRANR